MCSISINCSNVYENIFILITIQGRVQQESSRSGTYLHLVGLKLLILEYVILPQMKIKCVLFLSAV